jgi:hypothetical protein
MTENDDLRPPTSTTTSTSIATRLRGYKARGGWGALRYLIDTSMDASSPWYRVENFWDLRIPINSTHSGHTPATCYD